MDSNTTSKYKYILEALDQHGRWADENCGYPGACLFTSALAAKRALTGMVRVAGYERDCLRIRVIGTREIL